MGLLLQAKKGLEKAMDVLKLIKDRKTIRKYTNKSVPQNILNKIIEAGIWGPSLMAPGLQPWQFIVVKNKKTICRISRIMLDKSKITGAGGNIILRTSSETIFNAKVIIVICNSSSAVNLVKRFSEAYINFAKSAELAAISAAIQNMILTAESLGIGSCWLDAPLFCKNEIEKLLSADGQLVAILSLGYAAEKGRRSPRKAFKEIVRYIK